MYRFTVTKTVLTLVIGFVLGVTINTASSQMRHHLDDYTAPDHHLFHHWYQELQSRLNIRDSCCDENSQDCGPVSDYLDLGGNNVWVFLEDARWHKVSSEAKIIRITTPDGQAHACRKPIIDLENKIVLKTFQFFCIFLPVPIGS